MIHTLTYAQALNLAMKHEMEADPNVFAFGVDIADHKRTFGSGKDLVELFGSSRYFSTPVSEAAETGIAIGAALSGLRPVQIHARADFMLLAMNQLVNMASIHSYLSGGKSPVPLTVRCMIGRSWGQGPQHSKAMHSTFAHFPGLKVVMPSTPQDAYSLLRAAIQDDNPVLFFEHRWLYDIEGEVDDEWEMKLGIARAQRDGSDISIIASSWMVVEALQAAQILEEIGISVDVVDIQSAVPLDMIEVADSVRYTGHVIIADNDWAFCGLSSEISAQITEQCFSSLKKPPVRIGFTHTPCPTTRPLETLFYPTAETIVRAAEKLLDLDPIDLSNETFNDYQNRFKGPF